MRTLKRFYCGLERTLASDFLNVNLLISSNKIANKSFTIDIHDIRDKKFYNVFDMIFHSKVQSQSEFSFAKISHN